MHAVPDHFASFAGSVLALATIAGCHLFTPPDITSCDESPAGCDALPDTADVDDTAEEEVDPVDADGDGWYDDEDCDDEDPAVNPEADEICGDGVDNDCDGTANGCGEEGRAEVTYAALVLTGPEAGSELGAATVVGDVDADGSTEIAVGAWGYDGSGTNSGRVWLVNGQVTGAYAVEDIATATLDASVSGAQLGVAVYAPGDLDGDSVDDIITGADGALAGDGAAFVFFGFAESTTTGRADLAIYGEGGGFAGALSSGDINGDGTTDLVIGAKSFSNNAGAIYLIDGADLVGVTEYDAADSALIYEGSVGGAFLGWNLDAVGDLDGDGIDDLAFASAFVGDGGRVWVISGGTLGGSLADAEAIFDGENADDVFGFNLAAGDTDGDGYPELAMPAVLADAAGWSNSGQVYLIPGPIGADSSLGGAVAIFQGSSDGQYFGEDLAMGDMNGDGLPDLQIGAVGDADEGSLAGAVYVDYGPFSGTTYAEDMALKLTGPSAGTQLGWPITAGDADDDGVEDLLMGAWHADPAGESSGAVFLWPGTAGL